MDGITRKKTLILFLLFASLFVLFIPENIYKDFNLSYFFNVFDYNFSNVNFGKLIINFNFLFFLTFIILISYFVSLFTNRKLLVLYIVSFVLIVFNIFVSIYMNIKIINSSDYNEFNYLFPSGLAYSASFMAYSLYIILLIVLLIIDECKKINLEKILNVLFLIAYFASFLFSMIEIKYNGTDEVLTYSFKFNIYPLIMTLLFLLIFVLSHLNKRILNIVILIVSLIFTIIYLIISIITIKTGFFAIEYSKFNISLIIFALSYFAYIFLKDFCFYDRRKEGENYNEIK